MYCYILRHRTKTVQICFLISLGLALDLDIYILISSSQMWYLIWVFVKATNLTVLQTKAFHLFIR